MFGWGSIQTVTVSGSSYNVSLITLVLFAYLQVNPVTNIWVSNSVINRGYINSSSELVYPQLSTWSES